MNNHNPVVTRHAVNEYGGWVKIVICLKTVSQVHGASFSREGDSLISIFKDHYTLIRCTIFTGTEITQCHGISKVDNLCKEIVTSLLDHDFWLMISEQSCRFACNGSMCYCCMGGCEPWRFEMWDLNKPSISNVILTVWQVVFLQRTPNIRFYENFTS